MQRLIAANKILHICPLDKFIPPFISFIKENFEFSKHVFVLTGDINKYPVRLEKNIIHINTKFQFILLIWQMTLAKKILLHSLFDSRIVKILGLQPWLLKKCYWVMWGGDLYHYNLRPNYPEPDGYETIRALVIKRIGHFVTYIKGDYELARQWYDATGQYHKCLMYTSNIYKELVIPPKTGTTINILVGNSADPTNNHFEVFEKLAALKNENIIIYCPLSYSGTKDYVEQVVDSGIKLFGSRFVALIDFMSISKYLELLGQIDIAVFAHKRQQAMGNTITLLGLGKKVYMRTDVTPWSLFDRLSVKVFDFQTIDLEPIDNATQNENESRIRNYFSENNLINQLQDIFKDQ